uniref:Coiled-coil domain containing 82 n=1 Tax=Anas platyrhynchos TaxID=8839 RepID=A0A8B9QWD2_ANAPL
MEAAAGVRRYETRNKTAGTELSAKSRVDWRRTKREHLLFDSDDESSLTSEEEESTESTVSEDGVGEKDEAVLKNGFSDQEEKIHSGEITDDECVVPGKRKRLNSSVLHDSDESEDSDILVRKVFAKRHCIINEDESSQEQQPDKTCPTENVSTSRKQKVVAKLNALARQRKRNHSVTSHQQKKAKLTVTALKDFIVDDEEEEGDDDDTEQEKKTYCVTVSLLILFFFFFNSAYFFPVSRCSPYVHFKRIVKAFLINAIDDTFLNSLYDGTRQKKYAQDMLLSLHYLDDRFVQPRLDNLISRSRWKDRYKERVDCYPNVRIVLKNPTNKFCHACGLNRYCKFNVLLSGKLYDSRTLEADEFMSDDKQVLKVGVVCANRTRVYHNLKHFKYKLYVDCSSITKLDGVEDEPVKDTVERLFSHLEDTGWIQERYNDLENYVNDADDFQEEKMD